MPIDLSGASLQSLSANSRITRKYTWEKYILEANESLWLVAQDKGCYLSEKLKNKKVMFKSSSLSLSNQGAHLFLVNSAEKLSLDEIEKNSQRILDDVRYQAAEEEGISCLEKSMIRDSSSQNKEWKCYDLDFSSSSLDKPLESLPNLYIAEVGNKIHENIYNDYVLLHNPTETSISLENLYLGRDSTCSIEEGNWSEFIALPKESIEAGAYYLIAREGSSFASHLSWRGSITSHYCLVLSYGTRYISSLEDKAVIDYAYFEDLLEGKVKRRSFLENCSYDSLDIEKNLDWLDILDIDVPFEEKCLSVNND